MGGNPRYWTCLESSIPFLEDIGIIQKDLDRLEQLEKENQELLVNKNVAQGIAIKLKEENDKLKQLIKQLKNFPNCDICDSNWHKGCMCLKRKIEEVLVNE